MDTQFNFRDSMLNWNRFVTAGIVTAGVLLKLGVALPAVAAGLGAVALANWLLRARLAMAPRVNPVVISASHADRRTT